MLLFPARKDVTGSKYEKEHTLNVVRQTNSESSNHNSGQYIDYLNG